MGLGPAPAPTGMTAPEWPHGAWISRHLALQIADEARCLVRSGSQMVQLGGVQARLLPSHHTRLPGQQVECSPLGGPAGRPPGP